MAGAGKTLCPCGGAAFAQCCGRFIGQAEKPQTAAELMRSRYTAYVMRDDAYLQATWHASTRPALPIADEKLKWIGLDIRKQTQDGDQATVEFVARYRVDGRAHRLHENSRFVREGGSWFYVDGSFLERKN